MMIGGALANALAFSGSSFLFSKMSKDSIDKERKRHDIAVEKLQTAQMEWQQQRQKRIDYINKQLMLEKKADVKFTELNDAMREYSRVFGVELNPILKPTLTDFYHPSNEQHERELIFITLGMGTIGAILYFIDRKQH